MYPQDEFLPISGLQHLLYCPRQCALIHVERQWSENWFTASGRLMHSRIDTPAEEIVDGVRIVRSMPVASAELGLYGVCDVVEFCKEQPVPVEYKRGKPKAHQADQAQLCAQAICIEEKYGQEIPQGFLYYGKERRRTTVELNLDLRSLTASLSQQFHKLIKAETTPNAEYNHKRCTACSLLDICLPQRTKRGTVEHYLDEALLSKEREE